MPFQVKYSTRHRTIKQVTLLTAGEDQSHICTPIIYLQAEVDGDLLGHTIEWEQLSGTAVVLQQSNTLTPFFNTVDNTDKLFRIWIDKNTPYAQYDDVLIYKTPTSFITPSTNENDSYLNLDLVTPAVDCNDINATAQVNVPPPTSTEGEETGVTIDIVISWQHPGDPIKDPYIAQYQIIENNVLVGTVPPSPVFNAGEGGGPPSDVLEYYGTLAVYRIDTYYNIAGREFIVASCDKDFTNITIPSVKAYNDTTQRITFKQQNGTYLNKKLYGFIVQRAESLTSNSTSNLTNGYLKRTNYSNITSSGQSLTANDFDQHQPWINITRYDPSGIGS